MARVALGPRRLAGLGILAGLLLTLDADSPGARPPVEYAGYAVMAADFHVHSFPGDGVLPPWDIAVEARRRRLDAVALTNHNSTHSWRLAQWLSAITPRGGAMLIPGEELTSNGYHLAVLGITTPLDWRQPAAQAVGAAHAAGAVAIAAHPGRQSWRSFDDASLLALDGVEVAHPSTLEWDERRRDLAEFYERAKRVHPSIAAIGSTDFHHVAPLGLDRTYVFARPATPEGILDAIRAGRTVACDARGEVYGPPELIAVTREQCRVDATAPPTGETPRSRAGTWLVWIGLVGLVLLGAQERT